MSQRGAFKTTEDDAPVLNSLYIHRNSIKYRLTRIRDLTGLNREDKKEMDYLALSLYITDV